MEKRKLSEVEMELIHRKVQDLLDIVAELEQQFPERHFTLDGHLVGSIGEVFAEYYYGVTLYEASKEIHDGYVEKGKVQIKITQRDDIVISSQPEYLIVLYLSHKGKVYEVFNGPGIEAWEATSKNPDSHNNYHMRVNKLMKLDKTVQDRIDTKHSIEKMKVEYKNLKTTLKRDK